MSNFRWKLSLASYICFAVGMSVKLYGQETEYRDPWLHPFDASSIWNTPIGNDSKLIPVKLSGKREVDPELEYIYQISNKPFEHTVYALRNWEKGVNGTETLDVIPIDDFLLGAKPSEVSFRTACAALLMPDRQTVKNILQFCRTHRSSSCFATQVTNWNLFDQNGMDDGRPISGMSILGGALVVGADSHVTNINHAVKILLPSSELGFGSSNQGYRWPAVRNSYEFGKQFTGHHPELTLGSLVTIDTARLEQLKLKLKSDFGKSFSETIYRYGAYVVDYARGNKIGLCATPEFLAELNGNQESQNVSVPPHFPADVRADLMEIFSEFYVVDDNQNSSVGGSGTRRIEVTAKPLLSKDQYGKDKSAVIPLRNGLMTDGELFPTYWNIAPRSREIVDFGFDYETFYSTPRSFRFKALPDQTIYFFQMTEETRAPQRVSVRANVIGNVELSLQVVYAKDDVAVTKNVLETVKFNKSETDGVKWTLMQGVAKAEGLFDSVTVMVLATGDGTVWLDDFDSTFVPDAK